MKVYFIRHGESVDDVENCYGGVADFPLTDAGREKSRGVARRLRGADLQIIFTSPLARARETADIIAKEIGGDIPVREVESLQERNAFGVLSGVNKELAAQIFRRILSGLSERPGSPRETLLGAEDFNEFIVRVQKAFNEVVDFAAAHGLERIAVVTHGQFTQTLFERVLKIKDGVELNLSAVNVIEYQPPVIALIQMAAPDRGA
jgi:broad specificity phosphatase PhoE